MTWRSWAIGLGALAAAMGVFTLFMHFRVLYLGVDSVAGFAVRGDQVVVFERVFGGEESIGGDRLVRLVRLDVRTGEVKKRVRADDGEWLGAVDGLVWFKRHDGLEARDFDSLEVKHAAKDLLQKSPSSRASSASSAPTASHTRFASPRRTAGTCASTSLHDGRLGFEDLVIVDGVIVLGDGHRVFALDAATGALKWKRTP